MNNRRVEFYRALRKARALLTEPLLVDVFPVSDPQNIGAQFLRRGLVVSVFSALEAYLEQVVDKLLAQIGSAALTYSALPPELRRVITVDALTGVATRMAFLDRADRQSFAEAQIAKLSGFQSTPPVYTAFGFSPKGSNIGHEDLKTLFQSFGITDAWGKLGRIANQIGASRVSLLDDFKNFAATRNKCAHDPSYVLATGDLDAHLDACSIIAMSADILCMKCVEAVIGARQASDVAKALASPLPVCRFIDMDSTRAQVFLERASQGGRVYRRHTGLVPALAQASSRRGVEAVIARDAAGKPFMLYWAPGP